MKNILIRNVNESLIHQIQNLAKLNGHSFEEEAKDLLIRVIQQDAMEHDIAVNSVTEWRQRLDDFSEKVGQIKSDSTKDIRELRDTR